MVKALSADEKTKKAPVKKVAVKKAPAKKVAKPVAAKKTAKALGPAKKAGFEAPVKKRVAKAAKIEEPAVEERAVDQTELEVAPSVASGVELSPGNPQDSAVTYVVSAWRKPPKAPRPWKAR